MQGDLMPDRHILTDGQGKSGVGVKHRNFLHVAPGTYGDAIIISAKGRSEPNTHVVSQDHVADDRCVGRDVGAACDDWPFIAECIYWHRASAGNCRELS